MSSLVSSTHAGGDFTEQTQFGVGSTFAIAWGDADGDGDPDLAVSNFPGDNELYINNGDGTFTGRAEFSAPGASSFSIVWADYDNDGDQDVAVGRPALENNHLYVNNGDGTFTRQAQFGTGSAIGLAWGDFDRDGDLDLAVGRGILGNNLQNRLYVNNGDGTFVERNEFGMLQSQVVVWGDYDDDGDLDLAVGNGGFGQQQQNFLHRNNGNGTFTSSIAFGTGDTAAMAWGDCDNDGDLDMAVGNWNATQCKLYINNGDGSFTGRNQFGARDTNTLTWGDYNNDGWLDLAVGNGDFASADQNYLYVNSGNCTFTEVAEFGLGSTDGIAWADYDDDGDLDVAAGNEHTPTTNYLYANNRNLNDSLTLHLVGRFHDLGPGYSNRDAVGAKVYAYQAGHLDDPPFLLGFREVEIHGGLASQNHLDPTFGLAGHTNVDVRIIWPGSFGLQIRQEMVGVQVGQSLTVTEEGEFRVPQDPKPDPVYPDKVRYLSMVVPPEGAGQMTALRVMLESLHHPDPPNSPGQDPPDFTSYEGQYRYVRLNRDTSGTPVFNCVDSPSLGTTFKCAVLSCTPEYRDWAGELGGAVLHVTGNAVVPSSRYRVAQLASTCAGLEETCGAVSPELTVATQRWGDVAPPFQAPSPASRSQPSALDIARVVDKAKDISGAFSKPLAQLQPNDPNPHGAVNATDIAYAVDSVRGMRYTFAGPQPCP